MTERRSRLGRAAQAGGLRAESAACAALVADGWEILSRRARTAAGEVDIVARRGQMVVFAEVKSRRSLALAAHALGERQRGRLRLAAEILLGEHPEWAGGDVRFDILLVDSAGTVRRVSDALREYVSS